MASRRSKKFEGLDLEPVVATVQARSLRNRTITTEPSPGSGQLPIVPTSEQPIAGIPADNARSLRNRTITAEPSSGSGQLPIVPISEPSVANGISADNARNLRNRTITAEPSPGSGQLPIVPISEPPIANGIPADNTRSVRSRTIKTSIVHITEPAIVNGVPTNNTRSMRSCTVKSDTSPCSGQLSIVHSSEPTIAKGIPDDNTRSLRSRKVKTGISPCSGQLSIVAISEPTIADRTPGDNTRSLRSRTIKTDTSPCSGQLSTVPVPEPAIANGAPSANTRSLRSRTIMTNTSPCSGQLSTVPISEPASAEGTADDNTRSLRSRTINTSSSPCSAQLSTVFISEPTIAKGTPDDNTRSLRSRKVKTGTSPCSGQLPVVAISEPTIADGTPGDNTRRLRSRTVKTETSPCSGQLSTVPFSEPSIAKTPADNIEEQVKLTEEGLLPEGWIKEVKLPGNVLRRKHTFYVDPKTGYAFHSLEDALQYARTGSILSCVIIPQKRSEEEVLNLMNSPEVDTPCQTVKTQTAQSSSQVDTPCQTVKTQTAQSSSQARLCPDGLLPEDWIKEEKSRKKDPNKKDMFYIDPKTGYAFRSMKDALRYIETGDILSCATRPQKRSMEEIRILSNHEIGTESSASPSRPSNLISDEKSGDIVCEIRTLSNHEIVTESSASPSRPSNLINNEKPGDNVCEVAQESQLNCYGLPNSWIKELRPRIDGIKMNPFYVDPDTGYAFLSLKDALRYVATGNIRSCLVRPRKRSIEDVQALISSSEICSISGMKTVQQQSLQLVQHDSLHRKRKRHSLKTSERKLKEDSKIKGDGAIGTASPRVKKRKAEPSCTRASPRLLALKAKIMSDCDENHEENTDLCNAMHDASRQPGLKPEDEAMAENGSSSRTQLQSKKLCKEGPMLIRGSPNFTAPETKADVTSLENKSGMMSKSVPEAVPSSQPCLNNQPSCHPDLEHKEIIDGASGNSSRVLLLTGVMPRGQQVALRVSSPLAAANVATDAERDNIELENNSSSKATSRRGKVQRELRKLLRASSHRSMQKVTTVITPIENKKSMMSNEPLESSPSLSHLNLGSTSQSDLELKEEAIEQTSNSLTKKPSCRGEEHRGNQTTLGASCLSSQNVTNDAISVQNKNYMMSNTLSGPLPSSLPFQNLKLCNQPDLELKEETLKRVNSSFMETPLCRRKIPREKPMCKVSPHLETTDVMNGGSSVGNKNTVMNNAFLNQSPSSLVLSTTPASQPDLEIKDKIQAANVISTGTSLQRGEKHMEKPMHFSIAPHQAALKRTTDCTYEKIEDGNVTNSIFETRPPFHPDLNFGSSSLPELEPKEEQIQVANGSSTGTSLQIGKKHTQRPVPLTAYSYQSALKPTTACTSWKNEDRNVTNFVFDRPPPSHPDLNLGSNSLPDMDVKEEVITAVNSRGSRTNLQSEKLLEGRSATIINSSHLSTIRPNLRVTSPENQMENNKTSFAVSELPLSPVRPDLNFGPTSQPYREPMEDAIAAVNGSAIRTTSWRVEPRREVPTCVDASPCLEALNVKSERASSKSNEKNSMAANALSQQSHYPGRPDLNLGPTSQLAAELQKEIANDSTPGNLLLRRNLHGVRPTPLVAMTQAPHCNYENSIKISKYFCGPVDSPASHINRGSTNQRNPGEVWHDTTTPTSTVITEGKIAPDLNMVPMSWSEPEYNLERALKTNPGPKLEQQQQPVGVNTVGEFHMQSPVHSEIPYQDPTMDALLSGQDPGPNMPHIAIDALNSPGSPFFGDFWHDPCLSYAFKTLTGGVNQQQGTLGLGPENNVNWTSTRNGGPSDNPSIVSSGTASRIPHYMNNGPPQYMNHGTPQQYMNHGTSQQYMNHGTSQQYMNHVTQQYMNHVTQQYMNHGTPQYMNNGTPQYMNNGTLQYMNNGTPQHMNNGTSQHMNSGMPQYMNNGMPFQK